MKATVRAALSVFQPTGMAFYDVFIPAVIMAAGSILLAVSGLVGHGVAMLCFGVGALIHIVLAWVGQMMQRTEDGNYYDQ